MRNTKYLVITLFLFGVINACGNNAGEYIAEKDPYSAAIDALENNRPEEAISILDSEYGIDGQDTTDPDVLSLYGSAYASKAGVDPLEYATALGATAGEGENNITKTFGALPEATDDRIADLEKGMDFMAQIDEGDRILADVFKMSMFFSAHMALITKKFDSDGLGGLSAEELENLSAEDAAKILASLDNASAILDTEELDGKEQKKAKQKVADLKTEIDNSEGATDQEKLQAYFSAAPGGEE